MITLSKYKQIVRSGILEVNGQLSEQQIPMNLDPIYCVDEKHATAALKDTPGIVVLCKYPSSDTKVKHIDNYSEENECLIYVIEKWNEGQYSQAEKEGRYEYLQRLMSGMKSSLLERFSEMREELATPFKTEYEYQVFGSFYGLSIGFSLKDFDL